MARQGRQAYQNEPFFANHSRQLLEPLEPRLLLEAVAIDWAALSPPIVSRQLAQGELIADAIYIAGGSSGGVGQHTAQAYDIASDTWQTLPSMSDPRAGHEAFEYGGQLYALGGSSYWSTFHPSVERYNPATAAWTTCGALPERLRYFGCDETGGKAYIIGGQAHGDWTGYYRDEMLVYDIAANTWSYGPDALLTGAEFETVAYDGKLYTFGGLAPLAAQVYNKTQIFDPATGTWSYGADMPAGVFEAGAGVLDDKIYVIGGKILGSNVTTVQIYDPATDTWATGTDFPVATEAAVVAGYDGGLLVTDGEVLYKGTLTAIPDNIPPTIDVFEWPSPPMLDSTVTQGVQFKVGWNAVDPDDDATISLYYDTDTDPSNGLVQIASGISEDNPTDNFEEWDTSEVTPGEYYIYGRISDGHAVRGAYGAGKVTVLGGTGFVPRINGFHFPNWSWLGIGHCGGMTYAAHYYYRLGLQPIPDETVPVGLFGESLHDQVEYIRWLNNAHQLDGAESYTWSIGKGREGAWVEENYAIVRSLILAGSTVPIHLPKLFGGHSVLAYGVQERGDIRTILIYDPNAPDSSFPFIQLQVGMDSWRMQQTSAGDYSVFVPYYPIVCDDLYGMAGIRMAIVLHSPATLEVTDPDGLVIDAFGNEVDGACYITEDIDADGELEAVVVITWPKDGLYGVRVIPDPEALPEDVVTVERYCGDTMTVLANQVEIEDLPADGYVCPMSLAESLGGRVFVDCNGNGIDDAEPGIEGVEIALAGTDYLGNTVDRVGVTDADGEYRFHDLLPGTYSLSEMQPDGYLDGDDAAGGSGGVAGDDLIDLIVLLGGGVESTGYNFGEVRPVGLSGFVYVDFNNDGEVDFGEGPIGGVGIALTGTDDRGAPVALTDQTDVDGAYLFTGLRPGTYTIAEAQPAVYLDGKDTPGGPVGSVDNDIFKDIDLLSGQQAVDYNFGERPLPGVEVQRGQAASIGFWRNKHGQELIRSLNGGELSTKLGDWLAATLPELYGASAGINSLAGKTNLEVANHFKALSKVKGPKLEAQVLGTALSVYVTNSTLAGTVAEQYGFAVTQYGLGIATANVGSCGAAFGEDDDTEMTILDMLLATDSMAVGGTLYASDSLLRSLANEAYSTVNEAGDG